MKTGSSAEKAMQRRQYFCKKPYVERHVITEFARHGDYEGKWKQPLRDRNGEFIGCLNVAL